MRFQSLAATAWLLAAGLAFALPAQAQQADAWLGTPFGVGRLTVSVSAADAELALAGEALVLDERQARAVYPAFQHRRPGQVLAELAGENPNGPVTITAWFLFTGEEPLDLTLFTPAPYRVRVQPRVGVPAVHREQLRQWWAEYQRTAQRQASEGDYPPLVHAYLTTLLARRLGLDAPAAEAAREPGQFRETFELLLGLESYRIATLKRTNLTAALKPQPANLPLPDEIAWPRWDPPVAEDVAVEPMALHVPEDCFYIRFGTFSNYLWFRKLLEDNGGELSRLVTLRGFDARLGQRQERQLALKQSALAEIVGPQVIKDVAMLGRDIYLQDGAATGILFETWPGRGALLTNDIQSQLAAAERREAAQGARRETVQIAGRPVLFLSTPDNRLRSFYAIDGEFHLVTTSRAMVERFFEAGQGSRALGQLPEFRHARGVMPPERDDTVFLYFSAPFFEGLLSPRYQVELARRIRAATDIELVLLARLAARAEGQPHESLEELVAGDFLPAGFGRREDGSGPVVAGSQVVDSLRGPRGSFIPIPDLELTSITADEQAALQRQAAYYEQQWRQLDPLMVGVKRYALNREGLERIAIDARISPFHEDKYQFLTGMLGPPITSRVTMPEGGIATAQMSVRGGLLFPQVPPHILFAGVQDTIPPANLRPQGIFETLRLLQTTPGYLGAWPKPGFLDMLPLGLGGGPPDALGYSKLLLGLWRRQWEDLSVLSFDYRVLSDVTPQLGVEQAESDSQVMLSVGDLSQARFASWVRALNYARARQASVGNLRLLHYVSQQFRLSREESLAAVEELIDAQLVCSLGGAYRLVESAEGPGRWTSTRLSGDGSQVPDDYEAPLLAWFRGLTAGLSKFDDRMVVHAELDMQRAADDKPVELPLFNLFQLAPKKEQKAQEPQPREF